MNFNALYILFAILISIIAQATNVSLANNTTFLLLLLLALGCCQNNNNRCCCNRQSSFNDFNNF